MKILLVDDDPMAAGLAAAILEESGHETVAAEHGVAAMELLSEHTDVSMVISDMNMPFVSGIELFHALREQGVGVPFVLLTGDDPRALLAREPGLDACLLKDCTLEETLGQAVADIAARAVGGG